MSDLDEELLLVVATKNKKRGRNEGHRNGEDGGDGGGAVSVPLKKRKQGLHNSPEDEEAGGDEDVFSDGYGSDNIGDEEDRARLNAMTELDREEILAERAERRQRRELIRSQKQNKTRDTEDARDARAPSRRLKAVGSDAATALKKLAAARDRKEKGIRQQSTAGDASDGPDDDMVSDDEPFGSDENDAADEQENTPQERRAADSSSDDEAAADGPRNEGPDAQEASYTESKTIQLKRTKLERWVNEPFFENAVKGCFVRFAFGGPDGRGVPRYVMMEVEEVLTDPLKPYKFGPQGATTIKHLKVRAGSDERIMPMNVISNQDISEDEYEEWRRLCLAQLQAPKSAEDVAGVKKTLNECEHYRYKPEDVRAILEAKRAKGLAPANLAAEKIRITILLDEARAKGWEEKAAEHEKDLQKVEDRLLAEKTAAAKERFGVNHVNQRNRMLNMQATMSSKNAVSSAQTAGLGGVDVFSRRVTRPAVYWRTGAGDEQASMPSKAATQQAAPAVKPLKASLQQLDPLDLIKKLDLNIDISMLGAAGGQAPLARKLLGAKWQDSISKHNSTDLAQKTVLTFADWKRRAGLM